MKCKKCSVSSVEKQKYCSNCGSKLQVEKNYVRWVLGALLVIVISIIHISEDENTNWDISFSSGEIMYTIADLNVRNSPSIKGEKLMTLTQNSKILTSGRVVDGWTFIGDLDSNEIGFVSAKYLSSQKVSKEKVAEAKREKQKLADIRSLKKSVELQFKWDGSHYGLVKYVSSRLKDPDSFKHIETTYWPPYSDDGLSPHTDSYNVSMTYSATNSFGGRVSSKILAEVSSHDGSVIQIILTD